MQGGAKSVRRVWRVEIQWVDIVALLEENKTREMHDKFKNRHSFNRRSVFLRRLRIFGQRETFGYVPGRKQE